MAEGERLLGEGCSLRGFWSAWDQGLCPRAFDSPPPAPGWVSQVDAPEFEGAVLPIKGEVGDRDGAGGAEDGRWQPGHRPRIRNKYIAGVRNLEGAIIAVGWGPRSLGALCNRELAELEEAGEEGQAGRAGGADHGA